MSPRTRLWLLLVTAPVLAFVVVGSYLGRVGAQNPTYRHLRVFEDVVSLISSNYVEKVDLDKVMRGAMRGLAEGLDGDSSYLPPDMVARAARGPATGEGSVGLELTRQFYLRVIAVRDGSPAARAKLMPGDFIRAIDGKPTRETSAFEGAQALQGAPGSAVTLLVIRGNAADPHAVELRRELPAWPEVTGRVLPGGTGYLRVAAFNVGVASRMRDQVKALTEAGASRLVIDVRSAAVGPIDQGFEAARLFVKTGTLAIRESKETGRQAVAASEGDGDIALAVVLLVDSGTAGPAEVFAAALQGNHRAELVGERTAGRAAVQKLVRLPDGSGLWLSHLWILTPASGVIHERGLQPDLGVEGPDVEFGAERPAADPMLDKAVERVGAPRQ